MNQFAPSQNSKLRHSFSNDARQYVRASFGIATIALLAACTTEPLVSRQGVSKLAVSEIAVESLLAGGAMFGAAPPTKDFSNFDVAETVYLGGLVPLPHGRERDDKDPANGTQVVIDGRKRGSLPQVFKLRDGSPHLVQLHIPAFQRYDVSLPGTVAVQVGPDRVEAWPPIIVDCLSGEVFTTTNLGGVDPDRNSGRRRKTQLEDKTKGTPFLLVTSTERRGSGWKKIGQMRTAWQGAAR